LKKKDPNIIQAAEMEYLSSVKSCTGTDRLRNEDIRNGLGIFPLYENTKEYKENFKKYIFAKDRTDSLSISSK
jgi:hypothetical protein